MRRVEHEPGVIGTDVRGRDAIVRGVQKALEGTRTVHHGHMPEIEITGPTTARGIWAMYDYVSWGDERDLIHDPKYRKGDAGYKKSYGPRQDYIAGYRDGYEQAVRRGSRTADADARVRRGGRDARRHDPSDRDDPYAYGRNGRYGDDRYDPYGRDGGYDDDVIYEEPPGRW